MPHHDNRFPVRGDNFDTLGLLDDGLDIFSQLEALSFAHDYQVALDHFHKTQQSETTVPVQEQLGSDND